MYQIKVRIHCFLKARGWNRLGRVFLPPPEEFVLNNISPDQARELRERIQDVTRHYPTMSLGPADRDAD